MFRSNMPHEDTVLTNLCRHVSFLLYAAVIMTVMNEIKFMDLVGYNTADERGFFKQAASCTTDTAVAQ